MGIEIEKKFLVKSSEYKNLSEPVLYRQGYLSYDKNSTVRVRVAGEKGFITIKGKAIKASRLEYEYDIPLNDAIELLDKLCHKPIIEKYRYKVSYQNKIWEVDEFLGDNSGLIIAEIELNSSDEDFDIPDWVGKEVTNEHKYSNSMLSQFPYNKWNV